MKQLIDGLCSVDKYDPIAKDKLWHVYFGLVYQNSMAITGIWDITRVETMEHLISKCLEKLLGVLISLTNVALHSLTSKLKLALTSLAEGYVFTLLLHHGQYVNSKPAVLHF